ncbi:uncharacterized protein DUF4174 [Gelidibacter algens]|jgi:hypothetical protein|uniref:Uncharacterized protein DUF4174 n=1 Tax=Gelidibacter algens TaxID=49280 RepID=A0A1A7R4V6_9FLAO|nr:DUF4174 domain-containing protein [Gelidibacter algens]OBX26504.1 hypothetical protein A9996_04200 [Gelidibacter algens]RAJ26673.1 uncharacterized protein DUF4174 [Gelidibacter algens]
MKKIVFSILMILLTTFATVAQNMSSHQWKERILIVLTTDSSSDAFKKQVQLFENNRPGLEERKLQIYLASPDAYKNFNANDDRWNTGGSLYKKYISKDSGFELVLIGLDGSIKLRTYSLTPMEDIFVTIDGMPMRRSEIKRNKN